MLFWSSAGNEDTINNIIGIGRRDTMEDLVHVHKSGAMEGLAGARTIQALGGRHCRKSLYRKELMSADHQACPQEVAASK